MGAIWGRWIDVLAAMLFAWRETWRARRALIVSNDNDQFIVRRAESGQEHFVPQALSQISSLLRNIVSPREWKLGGAFPNRTVSRHPSVPDDLRLSPPRPGEGIRPAGSVLAVLPKGTPVPDEVARAARGGFVILDLSAERVVVRRISVPAQAREFLPGIVRNQLERLSPWQADQAAYCFDAEVGGEDATLEVRIFITSRQVIASAQDELKAIGLPIDRIVAREGRAERAAPVTLWSRLKDLPRESVERARRQIGTVIVGLVIVSVVVTLWALSSAASIRGESEDLANRSRTLQRELQGSRTPAMASLLPAERAWHLKKNSPSAVIVLEVLSRALPDAAYLTELRLENKTLRIIGLANDAPSLIAPLERSGHFADVRFVAPTTRGPDGMLFRFQIEARVVPRIEITEN